jgi:hypothetical protein
MPSVDVLPSDQHAVLELVLRRGRSYDEIARMLSIDRAGVRRRALAAFDALGPQTGIAPDRRALITDFLLDQLPAPVAEETRTRLARCASERDWARVIASELTGLTSRPLPEIPVASQDAGNGSRRARFRHVAGAPGAAANTRATTDPGADDEPAHDSDGEQAASSWASRATSPKAQSKHPMDGDLRAAHGSRRVGAILLALAAVVALGIGLWLGGGGGRHNSSATARAASTSSSAPATRTLTQMALTPPSSTAQTRGYAEVLAEGSSEGLVIIAAKVPANSHNAYAVWLATSTPSDSVRLGYVPTVGNSGQFEVGTGLPGNASHYTRLLITIETKANPPNPGPTLISGPFNLG